MALHRTQKPSIREKFANPRARVCNKFEAKTFVGLSKNILAR